MHLVSRIEKRSSGRYQILLDGEDSIPLYWKELKHYGIEEGEVLAEKDYQEIMEALLPVRAKKKALHLLERMDRTEQQLRQKLTEGGYPPVVAEEAVSYVKQYHYIDDVRYAYAYMEAHRMSKSLRQLERELYQKGISKEDFRKAAAHLEVPDEEQQIREWMRKKRFCAAKAEQKETERFVRFLLYRGYTMSAIRNVIRQCAEDENSEM